MHYLIDLRSEGDFGNVKIKLLKIKLRSNFDIDLSTTLMIV
jgi:hypothetical protein